MRNRFAETVYRLGQEDPRICVIVADISPAGSIEKFRTEFPDRFINTGVAEQVMIGMAAGMAQRGLRPFAYTIATFALYRPFEMVRNDLAYQSLPVTVVGIGGGVVYSTLGGTHHAQEDIAVASAIPGMTVISPCDPLEVEYATEYCATQSQGPVYLRLGKAGEPVLTEDAVEPFEVGKARYIRRGRDICIMSYGMTMKQAMDVGGELEKQGHSVSILCVHTLKPLDTAKIAEALGDHDHVVIIEETSPHGGLGGLVKQVAFDEKADCEIHAFSLKDEFIHVYGSHQALLAAHGLSTDAILEKIHARIGKD
ncbi:transketolase [Rhodospirillaceae bacterium KN72]|uniref:Transketolase n=1 Tax=Pacificispira spongiicola TaxID=2729598 RepID=A0A7Y0E3V1_9PROT|nr:transketolase C-terminal domain-containing protein [Pacificispira spongiicola]NMM46723.1 transketolase [Pacificispira spongiicola]